MLPRLICMLTAWLLFCHVAQAEIHLTDAEGRQVTLAAPAQRAYIGFYYEDFLAVNGPESFQQVAAFSKSDWALRTSQWPRYQAALPRLAQLVDVGSLYNQSFDFERLLTTRPDLLILAKWQLDGFANYLPVLQQLNIPYIVVDFNQGAEVKLASIRAMGQAMGHPERAERLASEYRQSLEDTQRRIREAQLPPPTAYIELGDKGPGEYSSSYGASVWGPLLQLAGARNIAAGVVASPAPLRADYVLTQKPDVIFSPAATGKTCQTLYRWATAHRLPPSGTPCSVRPACRLAAAAGDKKPAPLCALPWRRAHDLRFYFCSVSGESPLSGRVCRR